MDVITTRELKERLEALTGQEVLLRGWIRNHRKQKNMGFIDFFDGTCFKNPQVVYDADIDNYDQVKGFHIGAAIEVMGKVVPAYKDPTTPEIQAQRITLLGDCRRIIPCSQAAHGGIPAGDCLPAPAHPAVPGGVPRAGPWRPWLFIPISRTGAICMCIRP